MLNTIPASVIDRLHTSGIQLNLVGMNGRQVSELAANFVEQIIQRSRASNMESLRAIDSDGTKDVQRFFVLDKLGDRLIAQAPSKLHHRCHQVLVNRILAEVSDETAIDLQIVYIKVLQLIEGRESPRNSEKISARLGGSNVGQHFYANGGQPTEEAVFDRGIVEM